VVERGNTAILVTMSPEGAVLDRRSVELTSDLPTHPYHHEGAWAMGRYLGSPWARPVSLADAIALVEQVTDAAMLGATEALAALATAIPTEIDRIAIRACPEMPPTIEGRIKDNRTQLIADSVMYRHALAAAAEARGWQVVWYDRDHAIMDAPAASGIKDIDAFLNGLGRTLGPPWRADHKLAAMVALIAMRKAKVAAVSSLSKDTEL